MSAERDFFLDAVAIAAEHRPEPVRYRKCPNPRCVEGEVRHEGYSLNPRSGVMGLDPQCEVVEECPQCDGSGAVPIFSIRKRQG